MPSRPFSIRLLNLSQRQEADPRAKQPPVPKRRNLNAAAAAKRVRHATAGAATSNVKTSVFTTKRHGEGGEEGKTMREEMSEKVREREREHVISI